MAIKRLTEMGVRVIISKANITTMEGAEQLIKEASRFASVGGIFNLAMVLQDAILENQTLETWQTCCDPKVNGILNLDKVSRLCCPHLDYFVAFSSVCCGRGNPGQANYGYANSVMERICEERRKEGLPALAIQWGTVGDAGFVADSVGNVSVAGSSPQKMDSCLEVLDTFLSSDSTVVSSIVKADKKADRSSKKGDLLNTVLHVLGIKNSDSLSPNSNLGDLGMDSLMGVEIKQVLERDYGTVMSMQEIRLITIEQLKNFKTSGNTNKESKNEVKGINVKVSLSLTSEPFIYLNDKKEGNPVFFLPPLEGHFALCELIARELNRPVIGLNWTRPMNKFASIEEVGNEWSQLMLKIQSTGIYDIVGYSFGSTVAFEIATQLQQKNHHINNLILLDGTPSQMSAYMNVAYTMHGNVNDSTTAHTEALIHFIG